MTALVRRRTALALASALLAACASPGTPPGGPEDRAAPVILKVTPDSGTTGVRARNVTVSFNEIISERPRTGTDLGAVVLLSPSDGAARIAWQRHAISLRPRKGLRANTAHTLEIVTGSLDVAISGPISSIL